MQHLPRDGLNSEQRQFLHQMSRPSLSRRSFGHSRASRRLNSALRYSPGSAVASTSQHPAHATRVAETQVVPIVVWSIAGEEILLVDALACETLLHIKKLISEKHAISVFAQRLVGVDAVCLRDEQCVTELPSPVQLTVFFTPMNLDIGSKLLQLPSEGGDVVTVEKLLRRAANPNVACEDGETPLIAAAKAGHSAVVQLLCMGAADLNWAQRDGSTPLNLAVRKGHFEVAQLLCTSGADVNKAKIYTGFSPLHTAVCKGNLEMVKLLCGVGANVNCSTSDKVDCCITPLHRAACEGNLDVAMLLCASGADVHKESMLGETSLFTASEGGHGNIVRFLVKGRADMDKTTTDGRTPLYAAAQAGHLDVALFLCSKGADRDRARHSGETPVGAAKRMGHRRLYDQLLHLL